MFDRKESRVRVPYERWGRGWCAIFLGLFAIAVAFTGGASRFDAIQILPLRSLSAVFLICSVFYLTKKGSETERVLTALLGFFALIVALQLAPLPPWLWPDLPRSAEIVRLDAAIGIKDVWRPLSLTPMRTSNVLGSLVVPGAALLLVHAFRTSSTTLLQGII